MLNKTSFTLNFILMLSMSTSIYASPNSLESEEKAPDVRTLVRTMSTKIPVSLPMTQAPGTPPSPRANAAPAEGETAPKRKFPLTGLLGKAAPNSSFDGKSSSTSRSSSLIKGDTPPSPRVRGFSYAPPVVTTSPRPISPNSVRANSSNEKNSLEELPKKGRKSTKDTQDLELSRPQVRTLEMFDPKTLYPTLIDRAEKLKAEILSKIKDSNKNDRIQFLVRPLLTDLETSITSVSERIEKLETTEANQTKRHEKFATIVGEFKLTINRAEKDIPGSLAWALDADGTIISLFFTTLYEREKSAEEGKIALKRRLTVINNQICKEAGVIYFKLCRDMSLIDDSIEEKQSLVDLIDRYFQWTDDTYKALACCQTMQSFETTHVQALKDIALCLSSIKALSDKLLQASHATASTEISSISSSPSS